LVVRISSASGLFRLEEGRDEEMPKAGTRVRLLLNRTTYGRRSKSKEISVQATLGELLWMAEFETTVDEQGRETLRWPAGVPSPGGKSAPAWRFWPTKNPDVFWTGTNQSFQTISHPQVSSKQNSDFTSTLVPVLVDGIATDEKRACVLINLRGKRYPKLSVNRSTIREWDSHWLDGTLTASVSGLTEWPGLTLTWLWQLERHQGVAARAVFPYIYNKNVRLDLSGENRDALVPVSAVGIFGGDAVFLNDLMRGQRPVNLLEAWRFKVWLATGIFQTPRHWHSPTFLVGIRCPTPEPGDAIILGPRRDDGELAGIAHEYDQTIRNPGELATAAIYLKCAPRDITMRLAAYANFGFDTYTGMTEPDGTSENPSNIDNNNIDRTDLRILSKKLDGKSPWIESEIPIQHILYASVELDMRPSEVVRRLERLQPLGVRIMPLDLSQLDELKIYDLDLQLLAQELFDMRLGWIEGQVHVGHIVRVSRELKVRPSEVMRRLDQFQLLGIRLPQLDPSQLDEIEPSLSKQDLLLLSRNLDGDVPWIHMKVSGVHILQASLTLKLRPSEVVHRLQRLLPLGIQIVTYDPAQLDEISLDETDRLVLSTETNGEPPWVQGDMSVGQICLAAQRLGSKPEDVAQRLERFALFGIQVPAINWASLSNRRLSREEMLLLFYELDENEASLDVSADTSHIVKASVKFRQPVVEILATARHLGILPASAPTTFDGLNDYQADEDDVRLFYSLRRAVGPDDETRARRRMAQARYSLPHLSDEEIATRIERLQSLSSWLGE
jgi:hypothetical protein